MIGCSLSVYELGVTANDEVSLSTSYFSGTCHVEGDNYIKTTDNVVFQEQIPGTCPFVLAQDARGEHPEWKILWQLNSKEQRNVIVEIKGKRIQLYQNMTLMVNKQKVSTQTELKMPGVSIERIAGNKLHLKAEVRMIDLYDYG